MASPTAHAPHNGPVDQPGEGAYLWARSGLARSATTRSNYVSVQTSIDWIVRDNNGNIISTTDISGIILHDSLRITQALNDEPDTCSFTLRPQDPPAAVPQVGQEIRIAWAPGTPALFHGYIVTSQSDWRANNLQPPWVAVQCQDAMWRFDARIVTYRFPAQSVTASIQFLVAWFCNLHPTTPGPVDFSTTFVEAGMPSIAAFEVVNQRPSTVMRTLMAAVAGGFYLDGLALHAWANSVSEPGQANPAPLTTGLSTLKAFRLTTDATQVRRRVIVEGRRTSLSATVPQVEIRDAAPIGIPIADATMFPTAPGIDYNHQARLGPQWVYLQNPVAVTPLGQNPPQTRVAQAFTPGDRFLTCDPVAMPIPPQGWIRIGNQYAAYQGIEPAPPAGTIQLTLASSIHPYGQLTVPIAVGETVEWVDCVMEDYPSPLGWVHPIEATTVWAEPVDTPLVLLATATVDPYSGAWPPLEGFVQDGRYSYAGATARAYADLTAFALPLHTAEWVTDDLHALPGRSQVIALSSDVVNPPINLTLTILRVELQFPLRTLPPRRTCTGGVVKPSTFMDLVVTESN